MVAIIGSATHRFCPLADQYREAGRRAGHAPGQLQMGFYSLAYVADTTAQAVEEFYPGYAQTFTAIGKERGWLAVMRA